MRGSFLGSGQRESCVAFDGCTTTQLKAHVTKRLVFYRFHVWYGCEVLVVSSMTRRGVSTLRCRLPGDPLRKRHDIPQWMFLEKKGTQMLNECQRSKYSPLFDQLNNGIQALTAYCTKLLFDQLALRVNQQGLRW